MSERQTSEKNADDVLARYRNEVREFVGELNVDGLPETRQDIGRLRLDQIFIRLRLRVHGGSLRPKLPSQIQDSLQNETLEEDRAQRDELIEQERRYRELPSVKIEPEPIDLAQAISDSRCLVILGAPGSGKTTMTRWLALTFAENRQSDRDHLGYVFEQSRLPVLIELRHLVAWIEKPEAWPGEEGVVPKLAQFIADDPRFHGDVKQPIQTEFEKGACLLLFDGLDEIADRTLRRRIAESIRALARDPKFSGNIILVTSRPSGFRDVDLGPSFRISDVQPFSSDDVRRFLTQWYATAYGAALHPKAEMLIQEIESKDRIAALATNPLLCSVIAIIYRTGGRLPNRRVDLYEECCRVLLETWDEGREIKRRVVLDGLDWRDKLTLLAELAYWMHSQGQEVLISREQVVERLKLILPRMLDRDTAKALVEAEKFVIAIEDQAGLIQGRGDGTMEFPHRTFQEYLAARHIADQPGDTAIDLFMPKLNDAWWEEVHALVLGILGGSGKEAELIKALLDVYPKPWKILLRTDWIGWLARWLFPRLQHERQITWFLGRELSMALQGYADARSAGRDPSVTKRLKSEVADFVTRGFSGRAAIEHLFAIQGPFVARFALKQLLNVLSDTEMDANLRRIAAEALSQLGADNPDVRNALLKAIGDKPFIVAPAAIKALGQLGSDDPEVRNALLKALGDDRSSSIRDAAAEALSQLGFNRPDVRNALIRCLGIHGPNAVEPLARLGAHDPDVRNALFLLLNDENLVVRNDAARALGRLVSKHSEVRTALLSALNNEDDHVRGAAAEAFGQLESDDPEVRNALLKALGDTYDHVRGAAAESLVQLGSKHPSTRSALLKGFSDGHWKVRHAAAKFFGHFGADDPNVRNALLKAVSDEGWNVRWAAVQALGQFGSDDPDVRKALVMALRDDESLIRGDAAEALGKLGSDRCDVRKALLKALSDKDRRVAGLAAQALGHIGSDDPDVKNALIEMLGERYYSRALEYDTRGAAAKALGQLGFDHHDVKNALIDALSDDDVSVYGAAAEALNRLGGPDVENALLEKLSDNDESMNGAAAEALGQPGSYIRNVLFKERRRRVRRDVARAFGYIGSDNPDVTNVLLRTLTDEDEKVRSAAAETLGQIGSADPDVRKALLKAFGDKDRWVRRVAAKAMSRAAEYCEGDSFSIVLREILVLANRGNETFSNDALRDATDGRQLPGYKWISLAERAKRSQFWKLVRLAVYVVCFCLLAAFGLAAFADRLPNYSLLIETGIIFSVLVPVLLALAQAYDWLKMRR